MKNQIKKNLVPVLALTSMLFLGVGFLFNNTINNTQEAQASSVTTCTVAGVQAAIDALPVGGGVITFENCANQTININQTINANGRLTWDNVAKQNIIENHHITLDGGTHNVTLDGLGSNRIILTDANLTKITLKNLSFTRGKASDSGSCAGGVIRARGANNPVRGAEIEVVNSTFTNNTGSASGGVICGDLYNKISISGSTFTNNSSVGRGGAVYVNQGDLSVSSSAFTGNQSTSVNAQGMGGAIYTINALTTSQPHTFTNVTFDSNVGAHEGGALKLGHDYTITDSVFINNLVKFDGSQGNGGAIHSPANTATISNTIFYGNEAEFAGGAVYISDEAGVSNETFTKVTFTKNKAGITRQQAGGALFTQVNRGGSLVTLDSVTMSENESDGKTVIPAHGGALYMTDVSKVRLGDSIFYNNCAYGQYGDGTLNNCEYLNHTSTLNAEITNTFGANYEFPAQIAAFGGGDRPVANNSTAQDVNLTSITESQARNLIHPTSDVNVGSGGTQTTLVSSSSSSSQVSSSTSSSSVMSSSSNSMVSSSQTSSSVSSIVSSQSSSVVSSSSSSSTSSVCNNPYLIIAEKQFDFNAFAWPADFNYTNNNQYASWGCSTPRADTFYGFDASRIDDNNAVLTNATVPSAVYHVRGELIFPAEHRTFYSDYYRQYTNMSGDYSGIEYIVTYYTDFDGNAWRPWQKVLTPGAVIYTDGTGETYEIYGIN